MEHTVKKEELENFDVMAKDWWDKKNLLHAMNELRIELVVDGLYQNQQISLDAKKSTCPLKGVKILDVGCGGGILTEALAEQGASLVGVDPATKLLEIAKNHLSSALASNVTYICGTMEQLDPSEHYGLYDAVVASEVLDHVNDWQFFLEQCTKFVKPGGSLFLSTINRTVFAWFAAIVCGEYILGYIPRGTHHYKNFIVPAEIILELDKCGFKLKGDVRGSMLNPITKRWSWCWSSAVTFALQAVAKEMPE